MVAPGFGAGDAAAVGVFAFAISTPWCAEPSNLPRRCPGHDCALSAVKKLHGVLGLWFRRAARPREADSERLCGRGEHRTLRRNGSGCSTKKVRAVFVLGCRCLVAG